MHLNSELLFRKYLLPYFKPNTKVLELGANRLPTWYCEAVNDQSIEWFTLDIQKHWDTLALDKKSEAASRQLLSTDEYRYPIDSDSFDVVFSGQVMEHVRNIWKWMDELKRITKPGGLIITILPVSWPYHVAPEVVDCWRIYPDGMKALMEEKGLEILVNTFESLEKEMIPVHVPTMPGIGAITEDELRHTKHRAIYAYYKFLSLLPGIRKLRQPISVAYDLVAVVMKPAI